ncbi:hypothetical protein DUP93_18585 [Salmonella enterica subsp. enterica serovar Toulon]|nr:hypothetical protein [Salmonella enterica subsp. enterica serovar Toulon]
MLNVYVICNNALVHKQYVIANSTERVQWLLLTTGLEPIPPGVIGVASLDTDSAQKPERTRST